MTKRPVETFLLALLLALPILVLPEGDWSPPAEASTLAGVPIDYVHPEAFRQPTWIEISLPSGSVVLEDIRVLTANRSWILELCPSRSNPGNCALLAGKRDSSGFTGWRGDFVNTSLNLPYTDLDGTARLRFRVTPTGGDWMIFRIQTRVTP